MHYFKATIDIIGVNPYVLVPDDILKAVFSKAGKSKGPVPVSGTVNGLPYKQTLIKYRGSWRLYINLTMLKNVTKRIGETIDLSIDFDPSDRTIPIHPKLDNALRQHPEAEAVFTRLSPSRQKEIVRYIAALKTEGSIDRNVERAIRFLLGQDRFVGREKPV